MEQHTELVLAIVALLLSGGANLGTLLSMPKRLEALEKRLGRLEDAVRAELGRGQSTSPAE